ncbi:MAG: GyrI-like domain-containing protein [Phycisphaerae bacterium]|nr:GyrI-like domain-containing protein [Phycisphaerae bacterium]
MSANTTASLSVSIKVLPAVHVAYLNYKVKGGQGDIHNEIGNSFQRVQDWVKKCGYDPYTLLNVGIPNVVDGQLLSYECCIQVPEQVQNGSDGVDIKVLPGGQYAVVSLEKAPQIIGPSIGRFYQEYVPQNNIEIDGTRPTYEIYYESTMEYCVPIKQ